MEEAVSDELTDILDYYDSDPEREHVRLERHQLEYDLTWRYLDRWLPPAGNILEIGAATGRYTLGLARKGYAVTAVDISQALLDKCRAILVEAGLGDKVTYAVADARDLTKVAGESFDAVLLMGPLYHLVDETDRLAALREAYQHLKPGSRIFSAFISRLGIMGELIRRTPEWIENQAEVRSILALGRDPEHQPKGGFRGYFAQVSEIAPLHEAAGFETILLAGVEPGISADDESYNCLEGERRCLWLDLLYEISNEPSIIGASRHLLYIGQKPA